MCTIAADPTVKNWLSTIGRQIFETPPVLAFDLFGMQRLLKWKSVHDMREGFVRSYSKSLTKVLQSVGSQVASHVIHSSNVSSATAIISSSSVQSKFHDWYKRFYADVMKDFGNRAIQDVAPKVKAWDPFQDIVTSWTKKVTARNISNVTKSTQKRIAVIIRDGIQNGDSLYDISEVLMNSFSFSEGRAERIARTEVIGASNAGTHFGVQQKLGDLELVKEWLATADGRTRDDHVKANGQKQSMDDPFTVGGYKLMFPGDPSLGAGPEELVNCRCTTLYHRKGRRRW